MGRRGPDRGRHGRRLVRRATEHELRRSLSGPSHPPGEGLPPAHGGRRHAGAPLPPRQRHALRLSGRRSGPHQDPAGVSDRHGGPAAADQERHKDQPVHPGVPEQCGDRPELPEYPMVCPAGDSGWAEHGERGVCHHAQPDRILLEPHLSQLSILRGAQRE